MTSEHTPQKHTLKKKKSYHLPLQNSQPNTEKDIDNKGPSAVFTRSVSQWDCYICTLKYHVQGAKWREVELTTEVNNYLRMAILNENFLYSNSWIIIMSSTVSEKLTSLLAV